MENTLPSEHNVDDDLDPRIQIELEKLNNCTDEINKLEMELDEANGTFRMLMNDSTRRITLWAHKLGSCVEKARPYYEALEISKKAQFECQKAAVKFQRSSEFHAAAKETVAVAEAKYVSKQEEWQFDTAWQEMLNHATKQVMEAEHKKADSGREHQKRATLYNAAEQKKQALEQRLKRSIVKSRPYFEEKALCESGLVAQKRRLAELQEAVAGAKARYAHALRALECISEEIHQRRKNMPCGPREPGVGAELAPPLPSEEPPPNYPVASVACSSSYSGGSRGGGKEACRDLECTIDVDDTISLGSISRATSSVVSDSDDPEEDLEALRGQVRELAQMSGGERNERWENELSETIRRLDHALHLRECEDELRTTAEGHR